MAMAQVVGQGDDAAHLHARRRARPRTASPPARWCGPTIVPSTLKVRSVSSSDCPSRSSCASPASMSSRAVSRRAGRSGAGRRTPRPGARDAMPARACGPSCAAFAAGTSADGRTGGAGGSVAHTGLVVVLEGGRRLRAASRASRPGSAIGSACPPVRAVRLARLQPLQRVPGERHQRERATARGSRAARRRPRRPCRHDDRDRNPGSQPDHPGREPALAHVRVEVGRRVTSVSTPTT